MDCKKTFLLILAAYFANFEVVSSGEHSPSVIIIGAGASGIAAASRLFENGFKKITILEAENRIGGRINTTKFNRYLVDLGANWVFDVAKDTPLEIKWPFSLMKEDNCDVQKTVTYDSSGIRLDDETAEIVESAYVYNSMMPEIYSDEEISVIACKERELANFFKSYMDLQEKKGIIHMILMSELASSRATTGGPSTKTYGESTERQESIYNWKNRGYSTILDAMMKRYPKGKEELPVMNNTILNAEVSLIENNLKDGNVIIKTTDGNTYCADHVIVTIPLGVLKAKYNTLFHPPLPEIKIKTIQGLGYGSGERIFLFFQTPFWNYTHLEKEDFGFNIYWKDSDRKALRKDPERSWLLGLHEFIFVPYKPKLLMSRVPAKYSQDMDKLSDQQVFKHISEVIRKFFGRDYDIVKPTEMIRSKWNTNKNFRGTYTYYKLKEFTDHEVISIEDLAEPIGEPKPKILFAGEATHPHSYGTVQGAIFSGYREAIRLTELYPHLMQTNEVKAPSTFQMNDF